jgi:enediyne biosynthesis protein E4
MRNSGKMKSHRLQFLYIIIQIFICHGGFAQSEKLFELQPSSQTGVDFKNTITESDQHNALTFENLYNGGGVAIGDINNDGWDDIYFVSNMGYNKLYLNLGNFRFKDITSSAGVAGRRGWKTGVTMVDINGDRLLDIYVCYSGKEDPEKRRNQFFINKGNLTFEEKAKELNLDDPTYSTQASFFDYDKDGDLDVFLLATNVKPIRELEFQEARKQIHPYAGDKLFRNDNGHFTNVSEKAGILSNALGFGLGVAISDINKDGWPDIYISNDYIEPDYLYVNNGDGTFSDKLKESIQHISYFSMGSDISDVNNDAWPDIYTVDMLPEDNYRQKLLYGPDNYEHYNLSVKEGFHHQYMRNMLHINNANGTFSEIGQLAGVSNTDWSWAALFADYDNDGWKDLFVTNGYFRDYTNRDFLKYKGDYYFKKAIAGEKPDTLELVRSMTSTPLHNYIFRNNGDLTFTDKSTDWGFGRKNFSNGAAYSDLDNDGDLDLVINHQNERASVYRNNLRELDAAANYIKIQLSGEGKNTFGIGSKLYVWCENKIQYLEQIPTRGYQSSVSYSLHIGIGKVKEIDSVKVVWPSGRVSILKTIRANQVIRIDEKDAQAEVSLKSHEETFFSKADPPVHYKHTGYGYNDFKRQPMLMQMLSNCGPLIATSDVNGDDLTDVYVGGVKGNPGKLFIQKANRSFAESSSFLMSEGNSSTDADAVFFDADNDHDQDLYIAAGGYHDYKSDDAALQDRLYFNDGSGNFSFASGALPGMRTAKSCVRSADIDQDGDLDLFVGGRVIPGAYPVAPESYLLINDGSGHFANMTSSFLPPMVRGGMITDVSWSDLNRDGFPDLIMAGEFMPVSIFINNKGSAFEEATSAFFEHPETGLWNKLAVADFDHDGDMDVIAGNIGLNSQLKASDSEPMELVYDDFDKNGSVDPILTYFVQHKPYPFASRDEMLDQIYPLRKKFTSYEAYANAQLPEVFSGGEIEKAKTLKANELRTVYFENRNGKFEKHILPIEAQYAPVTAIEVLDVNHDNNLDFILAGNQHAIRIRLGAIDANYGQLFLGNGKNDFQYVPQKTSGLALTGDVKSLRIITIGDQEYLLAGINNNGIVAYKKMYQHEVKSSR